MKASTRNTANGTANIVKGKTKAAAGKITSKKLLQARGRAQELVGKLQTETGKSQRREGR
jgi:uncharacterized protein YjbJ (UPF0337 family)